MRSRQRRVDARCWSRLRRSTATTLSSRQSTFTPRPLEQVEHRVHVADARDVAQHDLLLGEEAWPPAPAARRSCSRRARCVPGQRLPAFDDELLHAGGRPVRGVERLRQGYRRSICRTEFRGLAFRPFPRRYPAARWPHPPATRPGSCSASGPSPTRCASTCWASRPRWWPTRASTARTRSCGPPPASCTTSTTSSTRTSRPATRASRSKLFDEQGYPPELIDAVAGHADFLGCRARRRWRRRSTPSTSCRASSPRARWCARPASTA